MLLANSGFLEGCAAAVSEAAAGNIAYRDLAQYLPRRLGSLDSDNGARTEYQRFLASTSFRNFACELWGHYEDTRKYLVFKNIHELTSRVSQRGLDGLRAAIKLPSGGASSTFSIPFWLDVLRLMWHLPDLQCSVIWGTSHSETDAGSTFVLPAVPSPANFLSLFTATTPRDVLDVERLGADQGVQAVLDLPGQYGQLLEDDDITLLAMLDRLATV